MKRLLIAAGILLSFIACAPKNQAAPVNPSEYQSLNQDNMQQVRDFLHKTGYYFLATVDGNQPEVRPFGTAEIIEGKLYIQTGCDIFTLADLLGSNSIPYCAAYYGSYFKKAPRPAIERLMESLGEQ